MTVPPGATFICIVTPLGPIYFAIVIYPREEIDGGRRTY